MTANCSTGRYGPHHPERREETAPVARATDAVFPKPYPHSDDPEAQAWADHFRRGQIVIGTRTDGTPLIWNLQNNHHALIAGNPGSGKTGLVTQILIQVASSETDSSAIVLGNSSEFTWAAKAPGVSVATSSADIAEAIGVVAAECERRMQSSEDNARLLILCDNFGALRRDLTNPVLHHLLRLTHDGGHVGIHVLVTDRRPTSVEVPPILREGLTFRAVTGTVDHYTSALVFNDDPDPSLWAPQRGWIITQSADGFDTGQIPWLPVATTVAPWDLTMTVEGAEQRLRTLQSSTTATRNPMKGSE